jgi:O-succinylbenzoic acid--CoA ligase
MLLRWEELAQSVAELRIAVRPLAGKTVCVQPTLERRSIALLMALLLEQCSTVLLPEHDPTLCQRLRCQFADLIDLSAVPLTTRGSSACAPAFQAEGELQEPYGEVLVSSSGSTGDPKILRLSARALFLSATITTSSWPSQKILALQLPLARVAGLGALVRGWVRRAPLLLAKPSSLPLSSEAVATHFSCVPSQLLRWWRQESSERLDLIGAQAQEILVGGSAVSQALLLEAQRRGWPVRVTYACTEAAGTVAMTPPGEPLAPLEVLPHWEWRMEEGCLALRGPSLAAGRVSGNGLIALADAEGWWRTADLIEPENRGFRWLRRADRVILSGGEKLAPERLEAWLMRQGCARAWVIGVPHSEWGERPVAFVAGAPRPASCLLRDMQELFGKRFAADAILPLPPELAELDKLPMSQLRQIWSQSLSREP